MKLELNGLTVACIIGDLPHERTVTQVLRVDLELIMHSPAVTSDLLADTVNYAALTEQVRETLVDAKCRMIERAASLVLNLCFADSRVEKARVKITKTGAVANLDSAAAVLEATRDEWRKGAF